MRKGEDFQIEWSKWRKCSWKNNKGREEEMVVFLNRIATNSEYYIVINCYHLKTMFFFGEGGEGSKFGCNDEYECSHYSCLHFSYFLLQLIVFN